MSEGWLKGGIFRIGPDGALPVVSVTRLPPELAGQQDAPRQPPGPRGEPGFGGAGEPGFAAGSVTGYRWWALDGDWRLRGMHATWEPGENTAVCLDSRRQHPESVVPAKGCYCGFYAWWTVQPRYATGSFPAVLGVIEGYGRVRTGTKGFRCAKARILALHLLDTRLAPDAAAAMARAYPGARVYRELDMMLAEFGPDEYYVQQTDR